MGPPLRLHTSFEERRAKVCEALGIRPDLLAGAQLHPVELWPIVTAVRSRPACRFLVFGCGNDSAFWEQVNAGGTTTFIENDPHWADRIRDRLAASRVYLVTYGTRLADWVALLDRPELLHLDLPQEVAAPAWDVILIDGPSGYEPDHAGRMQPIYAAPRLIAPGGRIFLHDCERPAEAAFASRYLGDDRLVLEIKGHALLRGYDY